MKYFPYKILSMNRYLLLEALIVFLNPPPELVSISVGSVLWRRLSPLNIVEFRIFNDNKDQSVHFVLLLVKVKGKGCWSKAVFFCKYYVSQWIRFPTMWHFDMSRLGRASEASF